MTELNDTEKLRRLIPHWIEHNQSHAAEFLRWADRARISGNEQAADLLENAAAGLQKAEDDLRTALEQAGGPAQKHISGGYTHDRHDK
jgi:hypothetical protein